MSTARAIIFGVIGMFAATAVYAQGTGQVAGTAAGFGGQTVTVGPRQAQTQATPLLSIGNLPVGIWAPVPPPYDVTANRSGAANPLW